MENHNMWPFQAHAYTRSNIANNHNLSQVAGVEMTASEEISVVAVMAVASDNNGRGNGGVRGNDGGRGNDIVDESSVVTNNDNYFNIVDNDQEGSSYSFKVNIPKMNANNYKEWPQIVRLLLDIKDKLDFLTRAVAGPIGGDIFYKQWKCENSLIVAWLVSSIEMEIGKSYMFFHSAKDV
ncbi:unnamed protein product [Vicia faba]|uniref:Retrotransposon Copia-like N-terminal domain-containing protein n=1 Tax=Vicia faba TaxID=3906 RepID=A0AAV1B518_VICFA|nr:unnamed protein product [Vicia faba]